MREHTALLVQPVYQILAGQAVVAETSQPVLLITVDGIPEAQP